MFVVLVLRHWEDTEIKTNIEVFPTAKLQNPDTNSIGFLEVFDTAEDAYRAYGEDVKLAEIREVLPKPE